MNETARGRKKKSDLYIDILLKLFKIEKYLKCPMVIRMIIKICPIRPVHPNKSYLISRLNHSKRPLRLRLIGTVQRITTLKVPKHHNHHKQLPRLEHL